ncbi:MAG: LytS/YhcK type 5TM receptor domain-containing protein, partial [Bacillota bacterium]|nr:LytS/YhcK type 5TM receptor domain-containing protein [Bacillota bacterium]
MITLLKPLMVNITILFSFTFNANLFFPFQAKVSLSFKQKFNYGMIGALGALFCMFYPIETLGDTHFDFRTMAILILTLYGGWLPGFIVLVAVLVARFILGGHFLYVGITVSLFAFVIPLLFRRIFLKSPYKIVTGTFIVICYFVFYIAILFDAIRFLNLSFYCTYFL